MVAVGKYIIENVVEVSCLISCMFWLEWCEGPAMTSQLFFIFLFLDSLAIYLYGFDCHRFVGI